MVAAMTAREVRAAVAQTPTPTPDPAGLMSFKKQRELAAQQPDNWISFGEMLNILGGMHPFDWFAIRDSMYADGFPRSHPICGTYDKNEILAWGVDCRRRLAEEEIAERPSGAVAPAKSGSLVYVVGFDDYVKIGYTKNFINRILALQTGSPRPLETHLVFPGTVADEIALHQKFADHRLHGEWFNFCDDIKDWIAARKRSE